MPLTQQQIDQLLKPLHPSRVMQKKGQAYLAAWDVRRWLLRIFGPGGWTFEVRQCEMAHQIEHRPEKAGEKVRWTVVYRAVGRLTIKDPDGFVVGFWEDGATGDGARQPSLGDAHDLAMKGLALDTRIPTPGGWVTMGDLRPGDVVFDMDGSPVRVRAVSPVKHLDCYRVTFRSGQSIVCDGEHLWLARVAQEKQKVHSVASLYAAKSAGKPVVVPVSESLDTSAAELPVDPWLLGYWLGNGSRSSARVTCNADDLDGVLAAIRSAGLEVGTIRPERGHAFTVSIRGLLKTLAGLGLLGDKRIPQVYMRGSIEQRRALLAGLMDSDGSADAASGRVIFTNTNARLAEGVAELARSLGEVATRVSVTRSGFGKTVLSHDVQWRPRFIPFALPRKALRASVRSKRGAHAIASIERIDSVPTKCISVDSPTRTYLAGEHMIPTHNTAISQALKRCAVNLGDQFGLGLYNNGRLDPVVARYLSGSPELPSVPVEDAPVESDEYDPTRETPVAAEEERPAGRAQQAPASQWEQPPAPDPRVGALLEKVRTAWTDAAELAALLKEAGDAGLVNAWVPTNSGPAPLGQMLTARLTDLAARAGEAPDLRAQLVEAARRAGFDEEQIREEFERNYGTAYGEASDDQLIDMRKLMEKAA